MAELKTLRVCLSEDLPGLLDRSFDYLYLAYDKLDLYAGQNNIEENYAITSSIPEQPVPGMIYILDTDGSVYRNIDYSNIQIAKIEDESQIEFLKKAGTLFRVNANRRYLDSQTRTLTLPFNNGIYELNVSVKNDQIFNNDTIMKYNPKRERFEIYGPMNEEFIDYSKPFRGGKSNTVNIKADGPRITAEVQVSKILGNLLKKASDGLYIKPTDIVGREEFDEWSSGVDDYKQKAQDILDHIDSNIKYMQGIISEENVNRIVFQILSEKFEDIQTALDNYEAVVAKLEEIEQETMMYAINETANTRALLNQTLYANVNWANLDIAAQEYTEEVNYYAVANSYLYPELTEAEEFAIITAAISVIMSE